MTAIVADADGRLTLDQWRAVYARADVPAFCSSYVGKEQCRSSARWWLYCDGEPNPGGSCCERHGKASVRELNELDGEGEWKLVALVDHYARQAFRKQESKQ